MADPQPACCLTGPCEHWREFDQKLLLARLRFNLMNLSAKVVRQLEADGIPITTDSVALGMAREVAVTHPRSLMVPWRLSETVVDRVIARVAADVVAERCGGRRSA
jgi:hypothetical protein